MQALHRERHRLQTAQLVGNRCCCCHGSRRCHHQRLLNFSRRSSPSAAFKSRTAAATTLPVSSLEASRSLQARHRGRQGARHQGSSTAAWGHATSGLAALLCTEGNMGSSRTSALLTERSFSCPAPGPLAPLSRRPAAVPAARLPPAAGVPAHRLTGRRLQAGGRADSGATHPGQSQPACECNYTAVVLH